MKFYDKNGNELEREEFIKTYSQEYKFEEQDIESVLQNGIQSKEDVIRILCWKIGGKQISDYCVKNYNHTIKLNDQIINFIISTPVTTDDDAKKALKEIMKVDNIGFTYAVTLLHFMSQGQYPIYDKFAHIALIMIDGDSPFDRIIKDSELLGTGRGKNRQVEVPSVIDNTAADKNEKIEFAFDKYKENYVNRINTNFNMNYGKEKISDRTVDRALWIYGHLFNNNKKNQSRVGKLKSNSSCSETK